ncbi:tetraspanin 37 isoform X3 [Boleophthalmus pectinirostris]|uniref:tetraspanin 37 isoform X3 n=1 Tax=Boleophthalmus pectinirostris TaxID=150288 RepID=UPI00242C3B0B|nr:tetraspanin 37 isoform X3 [Boleophthalmus pectinirostris]
MAGGNDGGPGWTLPVHDVQTEQCNLLLPLVVHDAAVLLHFRHRCVPTGRWVPGVLGQHQGFSMSARTASALTFHHTVMLDSELDPLSDVFKNYTGNSYDQDSRTVDALQEKMQCCGVQNYTDWRDTSWFIHNGGHILPLSCCNQIFTSCNGTVLQPDHFYQTGCKVKLKVFFQFLLDTVMWMFAVVFLVLVILLVPTVMLMREPLLSYQYLDKS